MSKSTNKHVGTLEEITIAAEIAEQLQRIFDVMRHPFQRDRTITEISGESMTHQSHKDACDVNNIVRKFDNTGIIPVGNGPGQYADVTALQGDLTEMQNHSLEVTQAVEAELIKRELDAKKQEAIERDKEQNLARIKELKAQLDSLESPPASGDGESE
jgi:hypothetical protein